MFSEQEVQWEEQTKSNPKVAMWSTQLKKRAYLGYFIQCDLWSEKNLHCTDMYANKNILATKITE